LHLLEDLALNRTAVNTLDNVACLQRLEEEEDEEEDEEEVQRTRRTWKRRGGRRRRTIFILNDTIEEGR
jgi:hypothetical protein